MSADVVAVLAETDHIDLPVEDCLAHHVCLAEARRHLAALTVAGIRCLYVPEGVAVEHGARLVGKIRWVDGIPLYAIEAAP